MIDSSDIILVLCTLGGAAVGFATACIFRQVDGRDWGEWEDSEQRSSADEIYDDLPDFLKRKQAE